MNVCSTARGNHPRGRWTAMCKVVGCDSYADLKCKICYKPTCTGCLREFQDEIMCEDCFENL